MKKVAWLLAGAVITLGVVFAVKPGVLEGLMPGWFAEKHRKTIRSRATELILCLAENNPDKCVDYVEQAFVREHGAKAVKLRFGVVSFIAKAGKITAQDVEIGDIRLNADNTSAEVDCRLRVKGEWKVQTPGTWVRVGDQWYTRIE